MELPAKIFEAPLKPDVVHQVAETQLANRRQVSSHVKGRGDVRGGGKKPWRQKGTGRARHGSIRSPIWVGGGVTHGPTKERNFKRSLNKKVRRAALFAVLSEKARQNLIVAVESLELKEAKTRALKALLETLPSDQKTTLIVLPKTDKVLLRTARNLPFVRAVLAKDLNALDLLQTTYVILPKESIKVLEETFV